MQHVYITQKRLHLSWPRQFWTVMKSWNDHSLMFLQANQYFQYTLLQTCTGTQEYESGAHRKEPFSKACIQKITNNPIIQIIPTLAWMAARSLSIPLSLRCSVITPVRSLPSSSVDSIILAFSWIQLCKRWMVGW